MTEPRSAHGDELRALAAEEAGRLRAAAGRPAYERRELLEDLGSRLGVLGDGVLRRLAEALAPAEIGRRDLDELWAYCLKVLDEYAASGTRRRRAAFWRR